MVVPLYPFTKLYNLEDKLKKAPKLQLLETALLANQEAKKQPQASAEKHWVGITSDTRLALKSTVE